MKSTTLGSKWAIALSASEASLARLKVIDAEFDLLLKLKEAGMVLHADQHGNLTLLPAIDGCDSSKLIENRDRFVRSNPDEDP